jgi:3-deoxy-D-manno-octulosonate 8-phosphate phosphatase (KDO 8-P phosphatase)
MASAELMARARRVRLLSCDVDGVLTDGRIYVDDDGREIKAYSSLDGFAMKMLLHAGIVVAWITGSRSQAVLHRATSLGVSHVIQNAEDKHDAWQSLRDSLSVPPEDCAHIGDDLPDLPVILRCGLGATVPHAPELLRRRAHYVTRAEGGRGAVRELAELLLAARGALDEVVRAYEDAS